MARGAWAALMVFALLPLTTARAVAPDSLSLLEITPELSPESHEKFFDHDYPDDHRPSVHKDFNFQHPFPVLQDSEDYDKDYVKDENHDGGEWQAQQRYDALRAKGAPDDEIRRAAATLRGFRHRE